MKKLFTILCILLVLLQVAIAGEVTLLTSTIVLEIEGNSNAGTISVTGANSQTTIGNYTYAVCTIDSTVSLIATPSTDYLFHEWSGNDDQHLYNLLPTDQHNPYSFTLFADAGFIALEVGRKYLDTIKVKASFRDPTICDYTFTISEHGYFVASVDALGSTLSIDSTTSPPSIKYNQVKKDNITVIEWPWNDVTFHFNQQPNDSLRLSDRILAIQVRYKAEHIWKMALPFNAELMAGGGSHMVDLPVSPAGFTTYTAYIDQFTWPNWYTDHQTPLVLDSVNRITFALDENAEQAAYLGIFQIELIKVCVLFDCSTQNCGFVREIKSNNIFNISPNPASISLTIETSLPFSHQRSEIQITNTLGQLVFSQHFDMLNATQLNKSTFQQFTIDVSQFSEGLYFIRVGDSVQKFIKE